MGMCYTYEQMMEEGRPGDVFKLVEPEDGVYMVLVGDIDMNAVPLFSPYDEAKARDVELGSKLSWEHRGEVFEYVPNLWAKLVIEEKQ